MDLPFIFVHGLPSSGKTYVLDYMFDESICRVNGVEVLSTRMFYERILNHFTAQTSDTLTACDNGDTFVQGMQSLPNVRKIVVVCIHSDHR